MARRRIHHRIANLFGYELISHVRSPTLDAHLKQVLRHRRFDLLIDVGANEGQFARGMRTLGYAGPILSFEPVTAVHERLESRASGDPQWETICCGLGAEEAEIEITIPLKETWASFHAFNDRGRGYHPPQDMTYQRVPVHTLDSIMDARPDDDAYASILLKTDTQGHDLEVLRGAEKTLERVGAIQVELSMLPLYEGVPDYVEVLGFLQQRGFVPSGFYPILRDSDELSIIEADGVLVKRLREPS